MKGRNLQWVGLSVIAVTLAGATGAAQAPTAQSRERADLRHQIFVMEGALSKAVEFGAMRLNRETRAVTPDMVVLAGVAHARGVYLDGYGVYFDVGVPILRQSMLWSRMMILDQEQGGTKDSLSFLKAFAKAQSNPDTRRQLEDAITVLEARVSPFGTAARPNLGGTVSSASVGGLIVNESATSTPASPTRSATPSNPSAPPLTELGRLFMQDPYRAYTESVQQALMDTMVDYSAPMAIGPEQWLTVAARDNERRDSFAPADPYEEIVTVVLSIKGADLRAYRAGAIDRDEVKRRIQIREF